MGRRVHPMGFHAESTLEFPMAPRITLVLVLALLPAAGQAGSISTGSKLQFRIAQNLQNVQATGHIRGLSVTNRHGRSMPVAVPPSAKLGDTLVLPPGDWAEITLTLDGPVVVSVEGAAPISVDLGTLTVPLEDPEAGIVVLDWALPDAVVARLRAGAPDQAVREALIAAIRDGVIARR